MENIGPAILDGEALEELETFTCLDSITDERGESDAGVNARIVKKGPYSYS